MPQSNNLLQDTKVCVIDSTIFPTKEYLKCEIHAIVDYSIQKRFFTKIVNHEKKEISIEELVDQYYSRPEEYFEL
jgi:hypothetical protein